jgi:insulysin
LSQHGGSSNAFTGLEHTCYYFDVQAESLDGALDRFSQNFICPLFDQNALEREIQAVDSEHAKNVNVDIWRMMQLSKTKIAPPGHPFGGFGSGNQESLPIDTIREKLLVFFQKYYRKSLGLYKLVVLGKEPMDELQAIVEGYFGKLVDQFPSDTNEAETVASIPTILHSMYPSISSSDWQVPQRLHVVPVSQVHAIELQFPMREILTTYTSKPTQYLSHLLGHEGKGSLLSLLKARHYATDLYADDSSKSCTSFSIFTVHMEVTELGLQKVDEIVSMVFAYVDLLKSVGPQQWIFDEVRTVADLRFKFLSQRNPFDYACSAAGWMQLYTPENSNGLNDPKDITTRPIHYLSGPYKVFEWKPELVQECLESLTPNNLFLMVSSPTFGEQGDQTEVEEKEKLDTERWYGTKFKSIPFDESIAMKWNSAKHEEYPELQLPEVNDMIATDFALLDLKDSSTEYPKDQPQCLHHDDNVMVWYKPDNVFEQPKVVISYSFSSGQGSISPDLAVATHLFAELVQEHCNEFSYQATMAGLYCEVAPSSSGLEIHVTGYNHKAHVLLEKLVDTMMGMLDGTSTVDHELFNRVSFKLSQLYSQFLVGQPYSHAVYGGDLILENGKCSIQDKINVLQQISLDDVLTLARGLLKNCQMVGLIHGNVNAQHAYDISKMVWDKSHPQHPLSKNGSPAITRAPLERRVVRLANDEAQMRISPLTQPSYLYRFPGFNNENPNSAIQIVFQMGQLSLSDNATLAMMNQLVREPAFNQLRTDEQLGYIVHTSIKTSGDDVKGLLLLIQSDAFDPIHVESRIEAFLSGFRKRLVDMPDEEFQTNIDSLVVSLLEKVRPIVVVG